MMDASDQTAVDTLPYATPLKTVRIGAAAVLAFVGLGLIGGSIAFAARRTWPSSHVLAVDREAVLREALSRRAIDAAASDLSAVADADLVVLAAPVRQNLSLLREVASHASQRALITDVGGTKRAIVDAWLVHAPAPLAETYLAKKKR